MTEPDLQYALSRAARAIWRARDRKCPHPVTGFGLVLGSAVETSPNFLVAREPKESGEYLSRQYGIDLETYNAMCSGRCAAPSVMISERWGSELLDPLRKDLASCTREVRATLGLEALRAARKAGAFRKLPLFVWTSSRESKDDALRYARELNDESVIAEWYFG